MKLYRVLRSLRVIRKSFIGTIQGAMEMPLQGEVGVMLLGNTGNYGHVFAGKVGNICLRNEGKYGHVCAL